MEKSHDELRVELKKRLAALMPDHGDAAATARMAGVPKTSLYTWMGDSKKAIPDAVDAWAVSKALGVSVEYLVTGEDGGDAWVREHAAFIAACKELDAAGVFRPVALLATASLEDLRASEAGRRKA